MIARLLVRLIVALLAFPASAQIPGGSDIQIDRTPVVGGTALQCLYVTSTNKVGNQACGSGTAANVQVGTTTVGGGTTTRVLYDNGGTLGEYPITGTGNVVMSASPTLTGTATMAAATLSGNITAAKMGIGTTNLTALLLNVSGGITGATTAYAVASSSTVQSDVTGQANYFATSAGTQAASFTVAALQHFSAAQSTIGATSAVTSQYGFIANASLTGAASNYGFFGNIPAAAGRWNFYAGGTAQNYFAGPLSLGSTALTVPAGALGMAKITASASAPGATGGKIELVCGTNAGTAKLVVYAGTSGTAVTITDNIGTGVTGC